MKNPAGETEDIQHIKKGANSKSLDPMLVRDLWIVAGSQDTSIHDQANPLASIRTARRT